MVRKIIPWLLCVFVWGCFRLNRLICLRTLTSVHKILKLHLSKFDHEWWHVEELLIILRKHHYLLLCFSDILLLILTQYHSANWSLVLIFDIFIFGKIKYMIVALWFSRMQACPGRIIYWKSLSLLQKEYALNIKIVKLCSKALIVEGGCNVNSNKCRKIRSSNSRIKMEIQQRSQMKPT